ncbi:MAG: molecular chaperone HtpG [Spirochaetes bacterium]|nr:MAG: molecular chaperone HtpG [Spirochaetota bacterium]
MSKHAFKTEVSKLLELITHSLYSHKEIFLRELISNASDAIDKLRYLSISDDAYKSISFDPKVTVYLDAKAKTMTVSDNGVGMDEKELEENLGTIARSGTRNFLERLSDSDRKNSNLIGQFGVGFYSVFMVADKVEVISKKAGSASAYRWESAGKGEFSIEPSSREGFGTDVRLHLNAEGEEYLSRWSLDSLLKKYSNHIAYPIHLVSQETKYNKDGKEDGTEFKDEQTNSASALWRRPKSELTDKDYIDFYKSFAGEEQEPLFWIHTKAEGTIEYNSLFYVPSKVPGDIYYPVTQQGVKLYIKRVFITDREMDFLPQYFRFVRGVVDSDDLPLNVSREILQQNRVMTTIQQASLKKIFSELESLAANNPEKYLKFVDLFGVQLKEGLASDWTNQKTHLGLARFKSTMAEGWTSLADYKARAGDRKVVYYVTGNTESRLRASPLLESFAAKGIEVLIGYDEIDELVFSSLGEYEGMSFKSVSRADSDEALGAAGDSSAEGDAAAKKALEAAKRILGSKVKDVRLSKRLAKSPSCVVMDADDPTLQYREIMKRISNVEIPEPTPILELNPSHPLVQRLGRLEAGAEGAAGATESAGADCDAARTADLEDLAHILLDQALLAEGQKFVQPAEFIERINRQLAKA